MITDPRQLIYQCTITLTEIAPAIWRRLQVPAAIPGERSNSVITTTSRLPFRKHQCENTPLM